MNANRGQEKIICKQRRGMMNAVEQNDHKKIFTGTVTIKLEHTNYHSIIPLIYKLDCYDQELLSFCC